MPFENFGGDGLVQDELLYGEIIVQAVAGRRTSFKEYLQCLYAWLRYLTVLLRESSSCRSSEYRILAGLLAAEHVGGIL